MAPSLQPHVTPDSFFHTTSPPRPTLPTNPPPAPIIVYFISGNPGLISYYYPFFTFLSDKLQSLSSSSSEEKKDHHQFYIHGHSLAGFEVQPQSPLPTHYHNVEDQIQFIQHKLDSFVQATTTTQPSTARRPRVIIMGHSVGTYIAMEVIRRHRERQTSAHSNSSITDFDIIGGVMLFPTVMDIASSPSGKKLTVHHLLPYHSPHLDKSILTNNIDSIITHPPPRTNRLHLRPHPHHLSTRLRPPCTYQAIHG